MTVPGVTVNRFAQSRKRAGPYQTDLDASPHSAVEFATNTKGQPGSLSRLSKQPLCQWEHWTLVCLIQTIGHHAFAFLIAHRVQAHAQPLRNSFRTGRLTVTQFEFDRLRRSHDDQRKVETALPLAHC